MAPRSPPTPSRGAGNRACCELAGNDDGEHYTAFPRVDVTAFPALPVPLARHPGSVWALGLVSLFMDVSSEMIHALLPIYLVTVLGTSTLTVGVIEGIAEATAAITKVFSGALSDRLGKRKMLAALGYGLAAFTKPIFPLASSVSAGWWRRASSIASARASAARRATP